MMTFLTWLKGRVRYLKTRSAWSSRFETVPFGPAKEGFSFSSVLPSTFRWIAIVDGQFLTLSALDALDKKLQNPETVGFGIECGNEEKFCLGSEFWKFVDGEESKVKVIFLYDRNGGQLNLIRAADVPSSGVTIGRKPLDFSLSILAACPRCDGESYCFPESGPRLPKLRPKPLPTDVTVYDYYPYEFKLTDFKVVEHNLDDDREWHIGKVVSVSPGCEYIKPGEHIGVCIWYDYHFSEETRSAAIGIRRVISYADGVANLGEPLNKGSLEW